MPFIYVRPTRTAGAAIPEDGLYLVTDNTNFQCAEFAYLKDGYWQENTLRYNTPFTFWRYFCPIPKLEQLSDSVQPEPPVNPELTEIGKVVEELQRKVSALQAEVSALTKQPESKPETEGWDYQSQFVNGFATVRKDHKWGVINEQGDVVVPVIYDGIRDIYNLKDAGVWVLMGEFW